MKATVKLYSLEYREVQTYLMAVLFIAGNIIFPQLCHTVKMLSLIHISEPTRQ